MVHRVPLDSWLGRRYARNICESRALRIRTHHLDTNYSQRISTDAGISPLRPPSGPLSRQVSPFTPCVASHVQPCSRLWPEYSCCCSSPYGPSPPGRATSLKCPSMKQTKLRNAIIGPPVAPEQLAKYGDEGTHGSNPRKAFCAWRFLNSLEVARWSSDRRLGCKPKSFFR